jgi:hypothetical protein
MKDNPWQQKKISCLLRADMTAMLYEALLWATIAPSPRCSSRVACLVRLQKKLEGAAGDHPPIGLEPRLHL